MWISYRDEIGGIIRKLDENEEWVRFVGGVAYFNGSDGRDYQVDVADIVAITEGGPEWA